MFELDEPNENRVLKITASEQLTLDDYEQMLPELEKMFSRHDDLRFYIDLNNVSGIEMGALWEDIKFDYEHRHQFGKIAIVGDKKWQQWATTISAPFFDSKIKFFDKQQSNEAWNWVNI